MNSEHKQGYILVVDDEQDVRDYLGSTLSDAGFRVQTAQDGFEALKIVKAEPPLLISLDLVMPKRSGVMFYRDLKKNHEWAQIPVLIITGHARDDLGKADFETLTVQGPGIYLEKPVTPKTYGRAVRKLLGMEPLVDDDSGAPEALRDELAGAMRNADPDA